MKVNLARLLAHLYCIFHPSWEVYWEGTNVDKPIKMYTASGSDGKGNFRVHVLVYPEWLLYKYNT